MNIAIFADQTLPAFLNHAAQFISVTNVSGRGLSELASDTMAQVARLIYYHPLSLLPL